MINLFYPLINGISNSRNNVVPDDSIFLLDGEESVLCTNCGKHSNKYFPESLTTIEFLELHPSPSSYSFYGQLFNPNFLNLLTKQVSHHLVLSQKIAKISQRF